MNRGRARIIRCVAGGGEREAAGLPHAVLMAQVMPQEGRPVNLVVGSEQNR